MTRLPATVFLAVAAAIAAGCATARPARIALIAGPEDHGGPPGHQYEDNVQLLDRCLRSSPVTKNRVSTTVVLGGWPADQTIIDQADAMVMISSGVGHNDHPLLRDRGRAETQDRLDRLGRAMKRGAGLVALHYMDRRLL
jgi:hypothetical protein